jgi:hypothetical protein
VVVGAVEEGFHLWLEEIGRPVRERMMTKGMQNRPA